MDKEKIKVLVFDLGNVLLPFDYSIIQKRMNDINAGMGDIFRKMYYGNYDLHRAFEKAELESDEFISIMLGWIDNKISKEVLIDIYSGLFTVNEKITELLPQLRRKYKLVLLSNTNPIHQQYGWRQHEFIKHFDKLILSHEVKAYKPEPEIYKAVEEFTNELPDAHFFIDDVEEYVKGAKDRGWQGEVFISEEQIVNLLRENFLS